MFIRFRTMTALRYGALYGTSDRECAGKCEGRRRHYPRYGLGMVVKGQTLVDGCPMKPLCPLKEPRTRLVVQIVETVREGGKVRQKHVASLGSLKDDTLAGRESFWLDCELRLKRLSNRLGPELLARLRRDIAARIPPLTAAQRKTLRARESPKAEWKGPMLTLKAAKPRPWRRNLFK